MKLVRRLEKIKQYPSPLLFQILVDRITFHTVQFRRFLLLEYAGFPDIGNIRGPGLVRKGETADINEMAMLENSEKRETFRERFSIGDHCAVAVHNNKIIGYEWYSCHPSHREQRYLYPISIPADAVYAYDAFIQPEYRISGIWVKLKKHLGEQMRCLGRRRIITMIDTDNKLSLNTHLRFGFTIFKSVVLLNLAGKRCFWEKHSGAAEKIS